MFREIFSELFSSPTGTLTRKELEDIGKRDYHLKIAVIIFALLSPFIIAYFGEFRSLSKSWGTSYMPLFIINNAITSYYLFSIRKWRIPAFFLLMLTGFPVFEFKVIHNIFAISFFVSCIYALAASKRMRIYLWAYVLSAPIFLFSVLWGEVFSSLILTLYHFHSLILVRKILREHNFSQ
jgi:hypothetical protein